MKNFELSADGADFVNCSTSRFMAIAPVPLLAICAYALYDCIQRACTLSAEGVVVGAILGSIPSAAIFVACAVSLVHGRTVHMHYCGGGEELSLVRGWSSNFTCEDCGASHNGNSPHRLISMPVGLFNLRPVRISDLKNDGGWRFYFAGTAVSTLSDEDPPPEYLRLWMVSAKGERLLITLERLLTWAEQPVSPLDCKTTGQILRHYPKSCQE